MNDAPDFNIPPFYLGPVHVSCSAPRHVLDDVLTKDMTMEELRAYVDERAVLAMTLLMERTEEIIALSALTPEGESFRALTKKNRQHIVGLLNLVGGLLRSGHIYALAAAIAEQRGIPFDVKAPSRY